MKWTEKWDEHLINESTTEIGWTTDKWKSIFTTHQFELTLIIPNYIKLTSDVFKLNLIINLDLFWCLVMLMISKLLSLSTWIYSVIFTGDLKFYSNWLPSDDYIFFGCDSSNCDFAGEYRWIDGFGWMEEWIHMDRWFILLIKLASYPIKK